MARPTRTEGTFNPPLLNANNGWRIAGKVFFAHSRA
jgi:hypothetical protein